MAEPTLSNGKERSNALWKVSFLYLGTLLVLLLIFAQTCKVKEAPENLPSGQSEELKKENDHLRSMIELADSASSLSQKLIYYSLVEKEDPTAVSIPRTKANLALDKVRASIIVLQENAEELGLGTESKLLEGLYTDQEKSFYKIDSLLEEMELQETACEELLKGTTQSLNDQHGQVIQQKDQRIDGLDQKLAKLHAAASGSATTEQINEAEMEQLRLDLAELKQRMGNLSTELGALLTFVEKNSTKDNGKNVGLSKSQTFSLIQRINALKPMASQ